MTDAFHRLDSPAGPDGDDHLEMAGRGEAGLGGKGEAVAWPSGPCEPRDTNERATVSVVAVSGP